jgi:hypothetical protein
MGMKLDLFVVDIRVLSWIFTPRAKNHENSGPVNILFNRQSGRRLYQPKELLHGEVHAYSESYFTNVLANAREEDRHLQSSTGLTTLTMTFKQTIFEVSPSQRLL